MKPLQTKSYLPSGRFAWLKKSMPSWLVRVKLIEQLERLLAQHCQQECAGKQYSQLATYPLSYDKVRFIQDKITSPSKLWFLSQTPLPLFFLFISFLISYLRVNNINQFRYMNKMDQSTMQHLYLTIHAWWTKVVIADVYKPLDVNCRMFNVVFKEI